MWEASFQKLRDKDNKKWEKKLASPYHSCLFNIMSFSRSFSCYHPFQIVLTLLHYKFHPVIIFCFICAIYELDIKTQKLHFNLRVSYTTYETSIINSSFCPLKDTPRLYCSCTAYVIKSLCYPSCKGALLSCKNSGICWKEVWEL
jgi:hypothetical protein